MEGYNFFCMIQGFEVWESMITRSMMEEYFEECNSDKGNPLVAF